MESLWEKRSECFYILISTANDEKNYALAQTCAQFAFDHPAIIGYVQRKAPEHTIHSVSAQIVPFGMEKEEEPQIFGSILKKAAFNVHYSYAKKQMNEKASVKPVKNLKNHIITFPVC